MKRKILTLLSTTLLSCACCLFAATDPTLDQILSVARQQNARYQVIKKTINNYDPARTNLFVRPARSSMQEKLTTSREQAAALYVSFTNQLAQTAAYSNAYVVAQRVASSATAKIADEIADLESKIVKYKEYQTKYPLLKSIFSAMITDAENRIAILKDLIKS